MSDLYLKGLELFNLEQFYDCHDALEELWLEDFSQDRSYYQGLIQVAVGFYHVTDGKLGAARSMLQRGLEKLRHYPPEHRGVQLQAFREEVENCKSRLDALIPQKGEVDFAFPKINYDPRRLAGNS
jgi:hypothetical protein